ncbi:MAG: SRPBCC family protein [Gammaproteobacteria bacterium]|nr:SRPBCC family protein [Gammaproteobacteria bacterium]
MASETYMDAPPDAVFKILADYDGFTRISKIFTETRYLERDEIGNGLVYSRAEGCVLFFCTKLERVEQLTVIPGREIVAVALPEQSDVDYSIGRWVLEPEGDGTRVLYGLEFKPSFWVPPLLGPLILRSKLRSRGREAADRVEELANASQIHSAAP